MNENEGFTIETETADEHPLLDAASEVMPPEHYGLGAAMNGLFLATSRSNGEAMSYGEIVNLLVGNSAEAVGIIMLIMSFAFYKMGTNVDNATAAKGSIKNGLLFYGGVSLARWALTHPSEVEMMKYKLAHVVSVIVHYYNQYSTQISQLMNSF